jgi:pimeloyl-ACP methyl ester carboxylesterase
MKGMILTSIPDISFNKRKIARYIIMSLITLVLIVCPAMVNIACSGPASGPPDNNQGNRAVTDTHKETGDAPARPNFSKCGDGICDEFERSRGICPQDCASDTGTGSEKIAENEYYVTNQTSGSRLYVKLFPVRNRSGAAPTVILIPGGTGHSAMFTDGIPGGSVASQFANAGFNAVVFDPEGRGRSEGREDFNGYTGQDGLYYITKFIDSLPEVGDIGYLSQSYGVTLATGVLARYKDGPAIFLIDWEGPVNREDTTVGCKSGITDIGKQKSPGGHSCADDVYWKEREASTFALEMEVPYHRVQSLKDHVQPDISHAVEIILHTTNTKYGGKGKSPWTRMNDFKPNTIFTEAIEFQLTEIDKEKYNMMIEYADYLFSIYGNAKQEKVEREPGTVYFGFMVHLEGWDNEMDLQPKFNAHASEARELADVFEDYGAKVTFEASPEFIEGCRTWHDNVLQELHNRGHGIGVHADKGYYPPGSEYTMQQFTADIKEMRENMEDLVGFKIQHVSGICSDLEWAKAAIDAGYVFTTGGVGYCAQSMPVYMRPEEYKACKNPAQCHGNMPIDMKDRIHPWRISTAKGDWTVDDPDGRLVNLASDGGIKNLYEQTIDSSKTHGDYEYSDEDIDIVIEKVEEAISLSDADKINILYFSLSIGVADVDTGFYSKMFQALQPYVDNGQLEYKTFNEMYQEYISTL